jgi:hypothetical protein
VRTCPACRAEQRAQHGHRDHPIVRLGCTSVICRAPFICDLRFTIGPIPVYQPDGTTEDTVNSCFFCIAVQVQCVLFAATLSKQADDDDPFIVLTETKFSIRYIPVWARYSPLRTRVKADKSTCDNALTMTLLVHW